jgi:hypothetical protein
VAANWIADVASDVRKNAKANAPAEKKPKKGPPPTDGEAAGEEIHRDWSNVMGGASGVGAVRSYPAKYNF